MPEDVYVCIRMYASLVVHQGMGYRYRKPALALTVEGFIALSSLPFLNKAQNGTLACKN